MNKTLKLGLPVLAILAVLFFLLSPSEPLCDEAKCVDHDFGDFAGAADDYFRDMDYGVSKDPAELVARLDPYIEGITQAQAEEAFNIGRNNWVVWTAGNDALWNELATASVGNMDFLKIVSNRREDLGFDRDNRWETFGVVNEPCYRMPDPIKDEMFIKGRYGLWLDIRVEEDPEDPFCADNPVDPFEDEAAYPGVEIGARGENIPVGSIYGYATGIVGLRLFTNPDFDDEAQSNWDPERYYTDTTYYNNKDLVRPYRVGMSCGFCHVGPNPTNPPANPNKPKWENLNSNPGAQYFWVSRVFLYDQDHSNFVNQLFDTSRPGALDTSMVSSDSINAPRTMNALYYLGSRISIASKWGEEKLAGGGVNNKQFNDYVPDDSSLSDFYEDPDTVFAPRILKDGADSVGALGALNRVFVNIGLYSEGWLQHFTPLIGGKPSSVFDIEVARENSYYWNANEKQTPNLALYFLAATEPDKLAEAPGGSDYLTNDVVQLRRGKIVFAENCANCHSSKLPPEAYVNFFPDNGCVNRNYLSCWDEYYNWTLTSEFESLMTELVLEPNFLDHNYLSNELRIPVNYIGSNVCAPLARNALGGFIWDNFSSQSYKSLPSIGTVPIHSYDGSTVLYEMPAGGRGYIRTPSLVSIWSNAPYLLNNSLGEFNYSPSVEGRMASFNDSIGKLLWPERRNGNVIMEDNGLPGQVDLTTQQSYLRVDTGFIPDRLRGLIGFGERWMPWLFSGSGIVLGPIPAGTPVNLISNIDIARLGSREHRRGLIRLLLDVRRDLKALPRNEWGWVDNQEAIETFSDLIDPLIKNSTCPDFVVNKGHYFGTDYDPNGRALSDADKYALIEYVKTF